MERFLIQKENGKQIPCIAQLPRDCEKAVIIIHGIASSKEGENAQFMLKAFAEKGYGAIAYDQPGHGSEEAAEEELCLENCLDSLEAVEQFVRKNCPKAEICYFGSSFGGYVLGLYLQKRAHAGSKAFMRSCAVIFPQLVLGQDVYAEPDPAVLEVLDRQGYIAATIDGNQVRFTKRFLEELKENSMVELYRNALPEQTQLCFVHGEKDIVVPLQPIRAFAEKCGYPITVFPGEGHSINTDPASPRRVAELAARFFESLN